MSPVTAGARWRAAVAVLAVLGAALCAIGCGLGALGPAAPAGAAGAARSAPAGRAARSSATSGIGATWTTAAGSWAALPMGHLRSASNTFWELLFRPAGSSRWTLVTPPGVASNGGIVGVSTPAATGTVTVGFQPAKYLLYSPVARTTDAGKKWSGGTLSSGLAPVADALATAPGGQVVALEREKGGTVVRSTGSLTRWTTIATRRAVAASGAGAACGLRALSAVAVSSGTVELGADCAKPGVLGLFSHASGGWQAIGPSLPQESGATMQVLRLTSTPAGTVAIVEAQSKKGEMLLALWRPSGQAWTASAPVPVKGKVLSAGAGPGLAVVAMTASGSGQPDVHAAAGPGSRWTSLAAPRGTQAVVANAAGSGDAGSGSAALTALAVSGSRLTVWSRADGAWGRAGRVTVPIEYGSST